MRSPFGIMMAKGASGSDVPTGRSDTTIRSGEQNHNYKKYRPEYPSGICREGIKPYGLLAESEHAAVGEQAVEGCTCNGYTKEQTDYLTSTSVW